MRVVEACLPAKRTMPFSWARLHSRPSRWSIRRPTSATAGSAPIREVGARTQLLEVTLDDYSYVVNDSEIAYTTFGKFCSIAAMTRINPGNHPMHRATQSHFTYRASTYFQGEQDEERIFRLAARLSGRRRP